MYKHLAFIFAASLVSSTLLTGPTHPSGSQTWRIRQLAGRPFGVRVASTGDVLVTEQERNVLVHLDAEGEVRNEIRVGSDPGDVLVSDDGAEAYVSNFFDGTVSIVDLSQDRVASTVSVAPRNAYRLALSKSGKRLYVTSMDGNLYTMDAFRRTGGSSPIVLGGALQGIALSHSGRALYVTSTSGMIWRLDAASLETLSSNSLDCTMQDVALPTDDAKLYAACANGSVVVLDPRTLTVKGTIAVPGASPFGLAITPDNAQLYVASSRGTVEIIDLFERRVIRTIAVNGTPRRVAFNASGSRAYVANESNWIDVIE